MLRGLPLSAVIAPWVLANLLFIGRDGFSVDLSERCSSFDLVNSFVGWIDLTFALAPEIILDDPIFQRMKGDYRQPPARTKRLYRARQGFFQHGQFVVHRDAQGLKRPRGGMDAAVTAMDYLNDLSQLRSC